jgi:hypothetical protein
MINSPLRDNQHFVLIIEQGKMQKFFIKILIGTNGMQGSAHKYNWIPACAGMTKE